MALPYFLTQFEGYGTFVILDKTTRDDGYGGYIDTYADGAEFDAVMQLDDSIEAQRAEKEGVTGVYTLTYDKRLRLPWHTVFKKKGTTEYFRVTSKDETSTPNSSALDMRKVRVEELDSLPN